MIVKGAGVVNVPRSESSLGKNHCFDAKMKNEMLIAMLNASLLASVHVVDFFDTIHELMNVPLPTHQRDSASFASMLRDQASSSSSSASSSSRSVLIEQFGATVRLPEHVGRSIRDSVFKLTRSEVKCAYCCCCFCAVCITFAFV
jgi:hypothetical protein